MKNLSKSHHNKLIILIRKLNNQSKKYNLLHLKQLCRRIFDLATWFKPNGSEKVIFRVLLLSSALKKKTMME